jgi:hypothetical protein
MVDRCQLTDQRFRPLPRQLPNPHSSTGTIKTSYSLILASITGGVILPYIVIYRVRMTPKSHFIPWLE